MFRLFLRFYRRWGDQRLHPYRLYPYLYGCALHLLPHTTILVGVSLSQADPRLTWRLLTCSIL